METSYEDVFLGSVLVFFIVGFVCNGRGLYSIGLWWGALKELRVTFSGTRVFFDVVSNGQLSRLNDISTLCDIDVTDLAHELARKHNILKSNIDYKSKG